MLYFGLILAIQLFGIVNFSVCTNYCDPDLCIADHQVKHHIGCNNNGEFSSYCVQPSLIPMTAQLRNTILYNHNDLRNKIANGSLPGFQSARRMTTLTWDSELEFLAGLNVRQCKMQHDECHNTEIYTFSGQNLAKQSQSVQITPRDYQSIIVVLINKWFDENVDANQDDVDKCSGDGLLKGIGHFTEMIQEKTSKVGCSIITYFEFMHGLNWNTMLMTCNYSFDNLIGWPIYVKGLMCSGCQTGCNPEFNGLCSISENVPPVPPPTPAPRSTQSVAARQSILPIPLPRTIMSSPTGMVSVVLSTSSSIPSSSTQADQSTGVISIDTSARTASLVAHPRSTQSLSDNPIPLVRSSIPVPSSPKRSLVPSQHSIQQIEPPPPNELGTTQVSPHHRYRATPQPQRQWSFVRSRRATRSQYSELVRPLLPIP